MSLNGSAAKRNRQNKTRHWRNKVLKSEVRTLRKRLFSSIETKAKEEAEASFKKLSSLLDSCAGKGIFHRNTVARKKSRLQRLLNTLA